MAEASAKRRGHGEDAIYFAMAKNRYVGAVSLGYTPEGKRIRRKVYGRTKQEVRDAAVPERAGIVDEWGPAEIGVLGPNYSNSVEPASLRFIAHLGEALGVHARPAARGHGNLWGEVRDRPTKRPSLGKQTMVA